MKEEAKVMVIFYRVISVMGFLLSAKMLKVRKKKGYRKNGTLTLWTVLNGIGVLNIGIEFFFRKRERKEKYESLLMKLEKEIGILGTLFFSHLLVSFLFVERIITPVLICRNHMEKAEKSIEQGGK